MIGNQN